MLFKVRFLLANSLGRYAKLCVAAKKNKLNLNEAISPIATKLITRQKNSCY